MCCKKSGEVGGLYSALGMQVRTKRQKKLVRPRIPMIVPTQANECWSLDFVHDQLADGRRIRILNVIDDYSRTCVGQIVDTSISGQRLANYLNQLLETRGKPKAIVMDNDPELTSKAMFFWSQRTGVKLNFIQPGKPSQNALETLGGQSHLSLYRDELGRDWKVDERLEETKNRLGHICPRSLSFPQPISP